MNLLVRFIFCLFLFCFPENGIAKKPFDGNDCLVGAYYFDGWSGSNHVTDEDGLSTHRLTLQKNWCANTKADNPFGAGGTMT